MLYFVSRSRKSFQSILWKRCGAEPHSLSAKRPSLTRPDEDVCWSSLFLLLLQVYVRSAVNKCIKYLFILQSPVEGLSLLSVHIHLTQSHFRAAQSDRSLHFNGAVGPRLHLCPPPISCPWFQWSRLSLMICEQNVVKISAETHHAQNNLSFMCLECE